MWPSPRIGGGVSRSGSLLSQTEVVNGETNRKEGISESNVGAYLGGSAPVQNTLFEPRA